MRVSEQEPTRLTIIGVYEIVFDRWRIVMFVPSVRPSARAHRRACAQLTDLQTRLHLLMASLLPCRCVIVARDS